jgi:hypothetical protein
VNVPKTEQKPEILRDGELTERSEHIDFSFSAMKESTDRLITLDQKPERYEKPITAQQKAKN